MYSKLGRVREGGVYSNKSPPTTKAMADVKTGSDQPEWCSKSNQWPLHNEWKSNAQADEALHLLIRPLGHCLRRASSSTHALRRTVMSPGLMHRTTQLERKKNVSLPSRAKAFACTGEFTVLVWILKSKPDQPRIYIVSYCVRVCGVTRRSQTELTAPAKSPLTCGLMALYKTPVLFCASSFFLLWHGNIGSSPRNTQVPHTHMDLFQYATLGLRSQLT